MPGEDVVATDPSGNQVILRRMPDGTWKRVAAPKPADGGNVAPRGVNSH